MTQNSMTREELAATLGCCILSDGTLSPYYVFTQSLEAWHQARRVGEGQLLRYRWDDLPMPPKGKTA